MKEEALGPGSNRGGATVSFGREEPGGGERAEKKR